MCNDSIMFTFLVLFGFRPWNLPLDRSFDRKRDSQRRLWTSKIQRVTVVVSQFSDPSGEVFQP